MFHSQMVDKLLTSVDEELQLVLCKPSSSSPAYFLVHMAPVEEDLAASIMSVDTKISQKNVEIKHLQESLDNTRTTAQNLHISYTYQKCQPPISEKQASMRQDIDQLNNQLDNLRLENKEAERALQEENEKLEADIEDLLQRFDSDMEEKQAKLELNEIECEKEEEELSKLKEPFSILETEYNQIQERRRLAEEKRQEEMRELELKTKAAIFAQAWWRGYSIRKALKNKGKNKRAKKGKGKKK
nr:PREDICTED: IQ domain-containing protein D-like [Paralichthys olivaceus]